MAHSTETVVTSPPAEPVVRSPAAQRMRNHRKRRRSGLRCFTVQVFEKEIDTLVRTGLLEADARNDPFPACVAPAKAAGAVFSEDDLCGGPGHPSGAWAAPGRAGSGIAKLLKVLRRLPARGCAYCAGDLSGSLADAGG
jgi:hypothetical protein